MPSQTPRRDSRGALGEQRIPMDELVDRQDVYGYDALARALLANDRANPARALMAELH